MRQKDYWDGVAETKQFTTPFQKDVFCAYVERGSKIADIGCGYGRTLKELHELGYEDLLGFDFSKEMIKRGKAQFPYLDLRVMEEGKIPLEDESVDALILFAVLTCIARDKDQSALIGEAERVLKPGGILYINDFLLNEDERNIARYEKFKDVFESYGTFELPEGAVVRHHSEDHIFELLKPFEKKEYERLTFTTMNGNLSNGFYYIGEKKEVSCS
ncbi:MAG: class I SAM-dependent methyltransferase [Erysipelotrichaceae bacterium]|nr:class I SAM-dependent methyltransferase [Erysipelotrichaceae bacterium]